MLRAQLVLLSVGPFRSPLFYDSHTTEGAEKEEGAAAAEKDEEEEEVEAEVEEEEEEV